MADWADVFRDGVRLRQAVEGGQLDENKLNEAGKLTLALTRRQLDHTKINRAGRDLLGIGPTFMERAGEYATGVTMAPVESFRAGMREFGGGGPRETLGGRLLRYGRGALDIANVPFAPGAKVGGDILGSVARPLGAAGPAWFRFMQNVTPMLDPYLPPTSEEWRDTAAATGRTIGGTIGGAVGPIAAARWARGLFRLPAEPPPLAETPPPTEPPPRLPFRGPAGEPIQQELIPEKFEDLGASHRVGLPSDFPLSEAREAEARVVPPPQGPPPVPRETAGPLFAPPPPTRTEFRPGATTVEPPRATAEGGVAILPRPAPPTRVPAPLALTREPKTGAPPVPGAPPRGLHYGKTIDAGSVNLGDTEEVRILVKGYGGLSRQGLDIAPEGLRKDLIAPAGRGVQLDELSNEIARAQGIPPREASRRLQQALTGRSTAEGPMLAEMRGALPPSDIAVEPGEWRAMSPGERRTAIQFYRDMQAQGELAEPAPITTEAGGPPIPPARGPSTLPTPPTPPEPAPAPPARSAPMSWNQARSRYLGAWETGDRRFRAEQRDADTWLVTDRTANMTTTVPTFQQAREWARGQAGRAPQFGVPAAAPHEAPPGPRFERTAIGDQGVLPGTGGRAMPTGALRPRAGQVAPGGLFERPPSEEQLRLPEPPAEGPIAGSRPPAEPLGDMPPADLAHQIDPAEWRAMGEPQKRSWIELFRMTGGDIIADESGALNIPAMVERWKRIRRHFPMESAVLRARPHSPMMSEVEGFSSRMADWLVNFSRSAPWQAMRGRGLFRRGGMTPDQLKDLEAQMVADWQAGGSTPASRAAAIGQAPPAVQGYMAHRQGRLRRVEQPARAYFSLDPIPEEPGPYLPRRTEQEAREAVSLGGGRLGIGRDVQTTVGRHQRARTFETYRQGEAAGTPYEDPRNAIFLREWESAKLEQTWRLFQRLEQRGGLFRTRAQAQAANPTGTPWRVENAPGGEWWTATREEAEFLAQNLTEPRGGFGSIVSFGNALIRNPSLVNPAPHVVKNMGFKAFLAQGPIGMARIARDMVEYSRGSNPQLLAEFRDYMPFAEYGQTAAEVLGRHLVRGPVSTAIRSAEEAIGLANKGSSRVIFRWADPAMRYSLYKQYRTVGARRPYPWSPRRAMQPYEAANNAWIDLVRYGTRSDVTDFWKRIPMNFFVPWRWGTFTSLLKQARNRPIQTALAIGALGYLEDVRYRQTGRWTHLPFHYQEQPLADIVKDPKQIIPILVTTGLFGIGGGFAANELIDMLKLARGTPDWPRLKNMFWGLAQIYNLGPEFQRFQKDGEPRHLVNMLGTIFAGEHASLTHEPRRLLRGLPETWPGMERSGKVQAAERREQQIQARREHRQARQRPKPDIEELLEGIQ